MGLQPFLIPLIILLIGIITALSGIGYEITPLITGMCIAGLAIALAAKNVLSNIFGGVAITIDQLYKVGENRNGRDLWRYP